MKKLIVSLFLLSAFSQSFGQGFYDLNTINTIQITFQESNWDQILDNLVTAGNEDRLLGSATINGQVFDSVGVRYKGNSSYNANQVKNPLNIKLDYVIDNQEIEGYGTIKLANAFKDPSFVRETMGYEIARKYFPAPLSNYAKVYINGTYLGLYTSDQDVDKFFMKTHFQTDEGVRIKGEIDGNAAPGAMGGVWIYLGTDSASYYNRYALESDFGWTKLIHFLDTLSNANQYTDRHLNLDRHLWMLAFENLLVNLDGPINNPQNYYLFEDASTRFNPIPWDLNECFGVFTMLQSQGNLNTMQLQQLSPFVNSTNTNYPVISKVLDQAENKKMYVAHMKTMLEENVSNGWYETRAHEIQDIIDVEVQNDPNKFYTYANFLSNVTTAVGGSGPPPAQSIIGLTQLMEARKSYILGLTEFQATAPELTNPAFTPNQPQLGETVWFTIEAHDATTVYMGYRFDDFSAFNKWQLFDDGLHHDGAAGDGVFGNSVEVVANQLQYYYLGFNDAAASFLPERAEYEFFNINLQGDVVINEFMADNESIMADQDGEYDDWIEFYNNGGSDIQLGGYYLTDNASQPTKWVFPDTTLVAGGYLVVWADEDETQEGLHASFKISASGESLILSDPGLNVIDQISFGAQSTDTSTGRFPNGTGDFVKMFPTFNAENVDTWLGVSNIETDFRIFPNPSQGIVEVIMPGNVQEVIIYNASGHRVSEQMVAGSQHITVVFQASGLYFMVFVTPSGTVSRKVVVNQ